MAAARLMHLTVTTSLDGQEVDNENTVRIGDISIKDTQFEDRREFCTLLKVKAAHTPAGLNKAKFFVKDDSRLKAIEDIMKLGDLYAESQCNQETPFRLHIITPPVVRLKQEQRVAESIIKCGEEMSCDDGVIVEDIEHKLKNDGVFPVSFQVDGCIAARILLHNGFDQAQLKSRLKNAQKVISNFKPPNALKRKRESDDIVTMCVHNSTVILSFDQEADREEVKRRIQQLIESMHVDEGSE